MQRKWGNSPSKDEPRDPRKHSFDRKLWKIVTLTVKGKLLEISVIF